MKNETTQNTENQAVKRKYSSSREFVGKQVKIEYESGVIIFDEVNEYRDYGNGKEFYRKYWVKYDDREYTDIGRSFFEYKTREAYMRAKRYAIKQQSK